MSVFVVDTNVAMTANGRDTHADRECQLRCVKQLRTASKKIVAVDDKGLIITEYRRQLNFSGSPGVGDAFSRYIFDNQYKDERVKRIAVTPSNDDRKGFEELLRNTFDRSDRKFLAVAVVADAVVLNATDGDWNEHQALMDQLNVVVEELCPRHLERKPGRRR